MVTLSTSIWQFLREVHQTRRERVTAREEAQLRSALRRGFRGQESVLLALLDGQLDMDLPLPVIDLGPIWDESISGTQAAMATAVQLAAGSALLKGGRNVIQDMGVGISFDLEHPRAARYLEQRGAQLITNIDNQSRREIQRILSNATREGKSYGVVRQELRTKFRQFHTPQPQLHIRDRAELIAVQEMGEAYEEGNLEMAQELRDLGITLEKSCLTAEDERVDDLCAVNERQGWIPLESQYQSGHQRPPFHVACLTGDTYVTSVGGVSGFSSRWYDGDIVVINTAGNHQLTCTPNHPILTSRGWVAAGLLNIGDDVINCSLSDRDVAVISGNQDMPALIHDVVEALRDSGEMTTVPVPLTAEDFHGDGKGSEIAIIGANRLLRDDINTPVSQGVPEPNLGRANSLIGPTQALDSLGPSNFLSPRERHPFVSSVSSPDLMLSLVGFHTFPFHALSLRPGTQRNTALLESSVGSGSADSKRIGDLLRRLTGKIQLDYITSIDVRTFRGHVYNLETESGMIISNGIITHNCRCTQLVRRMAS